ncbi:MINPP1 [Mytilus coruscus]|uniref:Multiple inositol polyphosphate phosphatase 1 n=1 Tax=Mytilus coruscus TaxID=42192 RepID=A0A6J8F1M0_MYTCO|nr:MINPP1 [Mytilus coruscus]
MRCILFLLSLAIVLINGTNWGYRRGGWRGGMIGIGGGGIYGGGIYGGRGIYGGGIYGDDDRYGDGIYGGGIYGGGIYGGGYDPYNSYGMGSGYRGYGLQGYGSGGYWPGGSSGYGGYGQGSGYWPGGSSGYGGYGQGSGYWPGGSSGYGGYWPGGSGGHGQYGKYGKKSKYKQPHSSARFEMAIWVLLFTITILYNSKLSDGDMLTGLGNNLFGRKCSYFWRFSNTSVPTNYLMKVVQKDGNVCTAVQLNFISRHGARMPTLNDYASFDQLKKKIKDHSKNQIYSFLKYWKNYPPNTHDHVDDLGRWESHYLGNLYGSGLYDLLHGNISPTTIRLTGTKILRTRTSASKFYKSLSERVSGKASTDIQPGVNNTILRYWDDCPNYDLTIKNNKTQLQQQYAFQNSSYFLNVTKSVTARLGLNTTLTPDDVKTMFIICATDLAVRNNTDWCSLQTEREREIINYESDLKSYYSSFYGHSMIQKLTCPLWEDLFGSLENAILKRKSGQSYVLADLRFGHADTIDMFYSALGLFHDDKPLRSDNFEMMKSRMFYESKVAPWSSHLAFVLYNCGGLGSENYFLKLIINGQSVTIPGCDGDFCAYNYVKAKYRSDIENCKWEEICKIKTTASEVVG